MHICAPRFNSNPQEFHRGALHRKRCGCSKWSPLHSLKIRRKIAEWYLFYKGSTWIVETFWLWKVFSPHHSHLSRGEFAFSFHTKSVNWNHHKSLERSLFNRLNTLTVGRRSYTGRRCKINPLCLARGSSPGCQWKKIISHQQHQKKQQPIHLLLAVTSYSRLDKIFIFTS